MKLTFTDLGWSDYWFQENERKLLKRINTIINSIVIEVIIHYLARCRKRHQD